MNGHTKPLFDFTFSKEEIAQAFAEAKAKQAAEAGAAAASPPVPATVAPPPAKTDTQREMEGLLEVTVREVKHLRNLMRHHYQSQGPGQIIGQLERRLKLLERVDNLAAVGCLEDLERHVKLLWVNHGWTWDD